MVDIITKKEFNAFKSPVDGKIISTHTQLNEHNKRHGVVDSREFSKSYYDKKAKERTAELDGGSQKNRQERREHLNRIIEESRNGNGRR